MTEPTKQGGKPFKLRDPADLPKRTPDEQERYEVTDRNAAAGSLPSNYYQEAGDFTDNWQQAARDAEAHVPDFTRGSEQDYARAMIGKLSRLDPASHDYREALDSYVEANGHRLSTPYVWRMPQSIPRREYVYGRELQRGTVSALIAPGSAGKTMLTVGRALALVTGRPLLGKQVVDGPKRVWLWNLEDDADELARMVQAGCLHWGITEADIGGRLMIDTIETSAIMKMACEGPNGFQLNETLADMLKHELVECEIDVFQIDPFVSAHRANENDNGQVDAIVKKLVDVAQYSRAAISLAHHINKASAGDVSVFSSRGAVSLTDACRSVLTINRMSDQEATKFGVEGEKRRRYFRTYDDKNNRAPPSDKSDWFHLHSVSLCNGGDDGDDDSVGVVVPWIPPDAFEGVTLDHLGRVQAAIDAGEWKAHHSASDWAGIAVAEVMGLDADAKIDRARIITLLKQWVDNKRFKVEERKDGNRQMKKYLVVDQWADDRPATPVISVA